MLVVAAKPPDQTHWYCPGAEQREEVSTGNGWVCSPQPWGWEQALVQVLTAPRTSTGQSQSSTLVPFFGMTSGKAAQLQGKDEREGMRMDTDHSNELRNASLGSLTTLNNRNNCLER